MSDDLTAARERHALGTQWTDGINPTQKFCRCGQAWPCDAARFRDALDVADAASMDDAAAIQELGRDLLAARALADELGHELKRWHDEAHRTSCPFICPTLAAIAKWEASK